MRIGSNPQRNQKVNLGDYFHQVIVPVYIPHIEGYYKESFEVFKLCIKSLIKTSHFQTYISVICNGSCSEVNDYVIDLHHQNKINDFVLTKEIGKVNSILKGLSGMNLPLVTISDADVLFLNGWQKATYEVLENFPKVGVISPVPNPGLGFYKTGNIFRDNFFNKKIKLTKIKNIDAVLKFAESVGKLHLFEENYSENYLTITNNSFKAVVGAGHFVSTYKSQQFDYSFSKYSDFVLGGNSEFDILDSPACKNGLWRLSTEENYAYHLGNTVQEWALKIYESLCDETQQGFAPKNTKVKPLGFLKKGYEQVSIKLFNSYKFRHLFLNRLVK